MQKQYITNNRIKAKEIRVIGDGENLGVMTTEAALKIALERGLDLVLIAPASEPPVAKLVELSKFLYQEKKKRAGSKGKKSDLKEIGFLKPSTGENDVNRYIDLAKKFLEEGHRVKVLCTMKGRQNLYPELGFKKIQQFGAGLEEVAKQENTPRHEGNKIWVIFVRK